MRLNRVQVKVGQTEQRQISLFGFVILKTLGEIIGKLIKLIVYHVELCHFTCLRIRFLLLKHD